MVLVFERTGFEPIDITSMMRDVFDEFPNISIEDTRTALRKGGLGHYGISYKISTQVICFWIREYLRNKKSKNLIL